MHGSPEGRTNAKTVEFFFDVASPYTYLAATQLSGVAQRTGAIFRWRPFLLGGAYKAAGNEMPARVPNKARYMLRDLQDWAAYYGVPFQFPPVFPVNSLRAMRACTAVLQVNSESLPAFAAALFEEYWVHGRDPSSGPALAAACARIGRDVEELEREAETQPVKDALRGATDEAVSRGAFGAPTFFVGERMFWGNDRITILERELK